MANRFLFKVPRSKLLVPATPVQGTPTSKIILRVSFGIVTLTIVCLTIATYFWLSALGVFNLKKERVQLLLNYNFQDNTIIFDRDGTKIGELFEKYYVYVPFHEIPQHFFDALIAIEDHSFYRHHGVDIRGIARALWVRLRTGKLSQGASTLTQQLVRSTFLNNEKSLERKALEIAWALEVERQISKEKILEIYANSMFLGNGAYGIGAAAQRYFGKKAQDLSPSESALLAGLFQSPSRYNPTKYPERAKARQLKVIDAMQRIGKISRQESMLLKQQALTYHEYKFINDQSAPWFVDHIQDILSKMDGITQKSGKQKGLRVYTTLNSTLQALAQQSVKSYSSKLTVLGSRTGKIKDPVTGRQRFDTLEAAMLVTDPHNGDVLAMVGGRNYESSKFNRTTESMRAPGSAFKPIVYTEALLHGFKWSDLIYVSPINIENYRPKNMEDDYLTETTMMRAFYKSMNAPTVELATKVGLNAIVKRAKAMGITSPVKDEFGSALGSSDLTMMDLARMYGTYASGGLRTEIAPIAKITNANGEILWERPGTDKRQNRALNPQISFLMTQGMRAVLTSGTGAKSSDLATFAAGKTGTTNNSSDNWFCGYTNDFVAIVWVGTEEHAPIFANVTGGALALPIWDQFIRGSMTVKTPSPFNQPPGITEAMIHPLYGHRVSMGARMYFLNDNQPVDTSSALESIENNNAAGGYRNVFRH